MALRECTKEIGGPLPSHALFRRGQVGGAGDGASTLENNSFQWGERPGQRCWHLGTASLGVDGSSPGVRSKASEGQA